MPAEYANVGSYTPTRLLASDHPVITRKITILSGNTVLAGTAVGKITVGGKYIKSLAAAEDGSEVVDLVMAEAVDASAGDKQGIAYVAAHLVGDELDLGTGHTVASIQEACRVKGLFID